VFAIIHKIFEYIVILGGCGYILYVGSVKLHSGCSHRIAIWLIVEGAVVIFAKLFWLVVAIATKNIYAEVAFHRLPKGLVCPICIYVSFLFAWFIVGHVWVYKSHWNDCDQLLYFTGFWFIIAVWIFGCVNSCLQFAVGGMSLSQLQFRESLSLQNR